METNLKESKMNITPTTTKGEKEKRPVDSKNRRDIFFE